MVFNWKLFVQESKSGTIGFGSKFETQYDVVEQQLKSSTIGKKLNQ